MRCFAELVPLYGLSVLILNTTALKDLWTPEYAGNKQILSFFMYEIRDSIVTELNKISRTSQALATTTVHAPTGNDIRNDKFEN